MQPPGLRAAAAATAFFPGLASVRLWGGLASAEERVAEWLAPASGVSVPAAPPVGREEDEQRVYEAVLRGLFDGDDPDRLLVLPPNTLRLSGGSEADRWGLREGDSYEMLRDCEARKGLRQRLPPLPDLGARVAYLDAGDYASGDFYLDAGGRKDFGRRFPNSTGPIHLSPIGFNRAGTQAHLHVVQACARGGTEWRPVFLTKGARGWELERKKPFCRS